MQFFSSGIGSIGSQKIRFKLDNFISRNLYICIEVIAHTLISLIVKCREENCAESLLIHLFSSQTCEALFRLARSLTSAECTVINFAMKELLQKIRRLDMLLKVQTELGDKLVFPREKRKRLLGTLSEEKLMNTHIPSNDEIKFTVLQAKSDAITSLRNLGVTCPRDSSMGNIKKSLLSCHTFEIEENVVHDETYESAIDEDDIPLDIIVTFPTPEHVCDLNPHGTVLQDPAIPPKTSHVAVPDDKGGFKVMSKSLLCWIFSNGGSTSLNNIRIHRVREKALKSVGNPRRILSSQRPSASYCHEIEIGNWCIFKVKSKFVVIQVLGFRYLSGKNLSYTLPKAPVKCPDVKKERGISCLGVWFDHNESILIRCSSQHKPVNIVDYVATIPSPTLNASGVIEVSPEVIQYITNL